MKFDSISQLTIDEWQYIQELLDEGYEIEIEAWRRQGEGSRYVLTWTYVEPVDRRLASEAATWRDAHERAAAEYDYSKEIYNPATGKCVARIVSSSEIAKCRWNRLDAQHWIPEHKVEQCDKELAEKLHKKSNEIDRKLRAQVSGLKRAAAAELAVYVDQIRKGKR